ncbi:hypothetical protein [Okeania sp. SIO2B3]|nr:hypothetical protein [Okeania sp. SIO2B3]NET41602.1 hypothetical protein [Okeania sp. SIO2B3]
MQIFQKLLKKEEGRRNTVSQKSKVGANAIRPYKSHALRFYQLKTTLMLQ